MKYQSMIMKEIYFIGTGYGHGIDMYITAIALFHVIDECIFLLTISCLIHHSLGLKEETVVRD